MTPIGSPRRFGAILLGLSLFAGMVAAHETGKKSGTASDDLHMAMMEGMKSSKEMKMTGDVDKDFATMMIDHHRQAIAMAKIEVAKGANPELKAMAQKMIDQQQKEIGELGRFK